MTHVRLIAWLDTAFIADEYKDDIRRLLAERDSLELQASALPLAHAGIRENRERANRAEATIKELNLKLDKATKLYVDSQVELDIQDNILRELARTDPVYGPIRIREPRANRLSIDEKPVYTSRRICALCRRYSADNGENVTHTLTCPWIPAKKVVSEQQKKAAS